MSIEQIHNYHERLVLDEVVRRVSHMPDVTVDMVADMACVALNQLPARYVRHDVDLVFYLTEAERHQIEMAMDAAIDHAIRLVCERRRDGDDASNAAPSGASAADAHQADVLKADVADAPSAGTPVPPPARSGH